MNKKTVYITRNELFKDISMIMCNNIETIDPEFIQDNYHLYSRECDECKGLGEVQKEVSESHDFECDCGGDNCGEPEMIQCSECYGECNIDLEVYQIFLVDCNDWKIEQLKDYGVELGKSELLDLYVLPIYDWGTSWSAFSYCKEVDEDYILAHNETLTRTTVY